jgi:hypothetical protein
MRFLPKRLVYAVQGPTGEWVGKSRVGGYAWVEKKSQAHFWKSLTILKRQLKYKDELVQFMSGLPLSACRAVEHRMVFRVTRRARLSELDLLETEFREQKGREEDASEDV